MKGLKSTPNIKKSNPSNPIEVDDSDASSILSSLESDDREDDEDDDEYDVAWMTDGEARQMLNNEVSFSFSSFCLGSEIICPSYPKLQVTTQLRCLTMITTSNSPIPSLIAASGGPARKPRIPHI